MESTIKKELPVKDKNDIETRIASLKAQLNNNPNHVDTAVQLGNLYYDYGDPCYAIVYYQHALSLNNELPGVKTDLGTMYWKNGDIALAERSFREVIRQYPGFGNAYINLGSLLLRGKHQAKEACALWKELIERFPDHPAAGRARQLMTTATQ